MADTASPSKAYRKSFISTRSADKNDPASAEASGRLRYVNLEDHSAAANVSCGISQAQSLSEQALNESPQKLQTSPVQTSQATTSASVPTAIASTSACAQEGSTLDETTPAVFKPESQSLRDSSKPAGPVHEEPARPAAAIDKECTAANRTAGTADAAKATDEEHHERMPASVSSPRSDFGHTGRAAPVAHFPTSELPQNPRWEAMSREAASAISATASASASPAPSTTAYSHVEFSVQLYSRGTTHWEKTSPDVPSIKLVSKGDVLMSADSAVEVVVRPSAVRTFMRKPYGTDNYKMVLLPTENKEQPAHFVFGPGPGSRGESGKRQSRRFVQWIQ
ncbi:hypothetical protein Micbo1qcDRAFT_165259, partial [Microdochium bolleyi]